MSRLVHSWEYPDNEFSLGDWVSFDGPYGYRMEGEVVRVYSTRYDYHVKVDGHRYSVNLGDNMRREKRPR